MLPFTKRPGRENENEEEVLTKDNLVKPPASIPPPPRSVPSPARAAQPSISDDEMTNIMPSKALGSIEAQLEKYASPRPAAGMPPPAASSRPAPASIPPPKASRPAKFAADADEEDGRTVVRGAPKIVKRTNPKQTASQLGGMPTAPTTISPAAVIKASLESANAGKKKQADHLMSPPPADLLEDLADLERPSDRKKPEKPVMDPHPADVGAEHTAILQTTGSNQTLASSGLIQGVQPLSSQQIASAGLPSGSIPPGSSRPMSAPPPPNSHVFNPAAQSGGYAAQSGGYAAQTGPHAPQSGYPPPYSNPVPSASVSVPGMATSMPAHFMVPQAPYSDGRVDPPGTAVTARTKVKGRAPMSWAVALLAFGVFVGVGWVAVQRGGDGGLETTASFVDPAKAGAPKAAAAPANPQPTPVAVSTDQPTSVSVPPVAVPATPPAPPAAETAAATTPTAPTPPAAAAPATPAATVAAATPAPPEKAEKPEKAPKKPTVHFAAAPAPAPAPTEKPEKPAKPTKPSAAVAAAAAEEASAPAPEKTTKTGKGTKPATGKGGGEVDEETKKALEALQKSQLESSF